MLKLFKRCRDMVHFCGSKYVIEPRYKLFYISEYGKDILTCRVPENIVQLEMHRPHGNDIYGSNVVGLSKGDIIKVTVHLYDVHPRMSILERTCAFSERYIRYKGTGRFEELYGQSEGPMTMPYITLFTV